VSQPSLFDEVSVRSLDTASVREHATSAGPDGVIDLRDSIGGPDPRDPRDVIDVDSVVDGDVDGDGDVDVDVDGDVDVPAPVAERPRLPVRVVRSKNRRKTVHARLVDGVVEVRMPARMSKADEVRYVAELVERIERREFERHVDLDQRVSVLARRFELPTPASIRFVDNQQSRWGSCSIESREIRLSSRLANFPTWVLDYVIVHELAHLVIAEHSAKFNALVDRYPRAERARGYLHAKSDGV
jgi:predicted metal-dependent hydrolase